MLVGIGTDIVEVARMAKAVESQHFQQRVFTAREVEYCQSRGKQAAQSFAARFAAKEAVLKAFGTGLRGGSLLEIEVVNDELGCPQVNLQGFWAAMAKEKNVSKVWLSLTHTKEYAAAQCVMEAKK